VKKATQLVFFGLIAFQLAAGGWLGIVVQDLTPALAARYGIHRTSGALVTRVQFNSPAMAGGLQEGDVVISLNHEKIPNAKALKQVVTGLSSGIAIDVVVLRDRREKKLQVVLGTIPRDAA